MITDIRLSPDLRLHRGARGGSTRAGGKRVGALSTMLIDKRWPARPCNSVPLVNNVDRQRRIAGTDCDPLPLAGEVVAAGAPAGSDRVPLARPGAQ